MTFNQVDNGLTYSQEDIDHLAYAYVIAHGYEGAIMMLDSFLLADQAIDTGSDDALAILCRRVLEAINDEVATIMRILDHMSPAFLTGESYAFADEFAFRPNLIDRHIGGRLQQRRVQLGWSTAELADRLHLSNEELGALEEGTTRIDGRLLDGAGECLGVPVGHFFQRDDAA